MSEIRLSFVIPARNEEALIAEVLEAVVECVARFLNLSRNDLWLPDTSFEVIVADDQSEDATAAIVGTFADAVGVRLVRCVGGTCAAARNAGAAVSAGRVLCFVDADTIIPQQSVERIIELHEIERKCLVLYRLASREPGIRAWIWWSFWGLARHLPLARAKSMPAFMSCDRTHFESYGPFNEACAIAEEWPLTWAAYRDHPERFLYDRSVTARTSSRRMELQPFGYLRTFLKWASVVLFPWARTSLVNIRFSPRGFAPRTPLHSPSLAASPARSGRVARSLRQYLAEHAYFVLCRVLGWLLRSAKYSKARIVDQNGVARVRKSRLFYAPLMVGMGNPLLRILDTGVRVLPRREWEARERRVYWKLHGSSIQIDADGALGLPCLPGERLASLLENPELEESVRRRAIELAVIALAEFHQLGFTHGDAMAENVVVDAPRRCSGRPEHSSSLDFARGDPEVLEGSKGGVAHWFDFETIHDSSRPPAWQRADDVRALLVTCLVRTRPAKFAETLGLILDVYADQEVTRLLAPSFTAVFRRPLTFHLAQAGLSFHSFQEIARLLAGRSERAQRVRESALWPRAGNKKRAG